MRIVSILAVSAALAACQPADTTEADADSTDIAAADEGMADDEMAIDQPDANSDPDAFVRNIYGAMADGELAPLGEEGAVLWSDAAWADIEAYRAAAPEGFNSDPLCNCQTTEGLTIRDLAVTEAGTDRADAAVTMLQGEAQTSIVLNLLREDGVWTIDNITREGDPTFRDDLAQWTAEAQG